jgi:hypothetical protein
MQTIKSQLTSGAIYNLGACHGKYNAQTDTFSLGNCFIARGETIYADNYTGLYMRDLRQAEIIRNFANVTCRNTMADILRRG